MRRCGNPIVRLMMFIFWGTSILLVSNYCVTESVAAGAVKAHVAWAESDGEDHEIFYSFFKDNFWSSALPLTDDKLLNTQPALSVGTNGTIWALWVDAIGTESRLSFCRYNDKSWSTPRQISSDLTSNVSPSIAVDNGNIAWIVWAGFDGQDDDIFFSRWNGNDWEIPLRVNLDDSTPDILPIIGIDETGTPFIYWLGYRDGSYKAYYTQWNGLEWEFETEVGGESTYYETVLDESGDIPSLPDFVSEPDKASIHVRNDGKIQSIPVRYLRR